MNKIFPPSTYAIDDLVNGKKGAISKTIGLTLARSLIIAPGLFAANIRGKNLAYASLGASTTVTLGMIIVKLIQKKMK